MIRRDCQLAALGLAAPDPQLGSKTADSPGWILVPQIEHAQVSGDLADAWRCDEFDEPFLASLRFAARHHDDGWAAWDEQPGVDHQGRPVNFDEMRLADSLSIWDRSIELSTNHSPLAGYLVAGHFCRLLGRFTSWQSHLATAALGANFLVAKASRMTAQLSAWQSDDQRRTRKLAELGVSYVQLFDAISLWLCCAERHEPWQVTLPGGQAWLFSPIKPERITIEPWPFSRSALAVGVSGRPVPRADYRTTDALLAAAGGRIEHRWELIPAR